MTTWGNIDRANNSPLHVPAQFNRPPNTSNRDLLFGNTTANTVGTNQTVGVFGVSSAELTYSGTAGQMYSLFVTATGAGYTNVIAVSIQDSSNNAANGTATATATMRVVGATIGGGGNSYAAGDLLSVSGGTAVASNVATINVVTTNVRSYGIVSGGTGYVNNDVVTIVGGTTVSGNAATGTVTTNSTGGVTALAVTNGGQYTVNPNTANAATTSANVSSTGLRVSIVTRLESIALINGGNYSALPTLTNNPVTGGAGSTANINLIVGLSDLQLTANGAGYVTPVIVLSGAGATNAAASGVALNNTSAKGVSGAIPHTGWNLRIVGSGGRAGRVQYETIVAGGITGDAADDTVIPE